jgi:hypothetical protein
MNLSVSMPISIGREKVNVFKMHINQDVDFVKNLVLKIKLII